MINVSEDFKRAIKQDSTKKKIIISFPNGDHEDITNKELKSESFEFEEHTCSSDTLKFGLCEGARVSFQAVDIGDITGKDINVKIEVNNESVPLGMFTVESCPSKAVGSRTFYKVSAYNKLLSKYLDDDLLEYYKESINNWDKEEVTVNGPSIYYASKQLLKKDYNPKEISQKVSVPLISYTHTLNTFNRMSYNDVAHAWVGLSYRGDRITVKFNLTDSTIYGGWSQIEYYRIKVNARKIREYLKSLYSPIIYKSESEEYMFSDSGIRYTWDEFMNLENRGEKLRIINGSGVTYNYGSFGTVNDSYIVTKWFMGFRQSPELYIPMYYSRSNDTTSELTEEEKMLAQSAFETMLKEIPDCITIETLILSKIEKQHFNYQDYSEWKNFTLRNWQSAVYEINCQFGKLDRKTDLFYGAELNQGGLLPADTLYPSDSLYPKGADESIHRGNYSNLLVGKQNKFRYLIVTYKTTETDSDGNVTEVEKTLQRTVNTNGNVNYNMSDNWLLLNLTWTADEVGAYADAMVEKMRDLTWCNFDLDATALPYLESGDMIEVTAGNNSYNTYILERNLKGIQHMQDSFFNGSVETF